MKQQFVPQKPGGGLLPEMRGELLVPDGRPSSRRACGLPQVLLVFTRLCSPTIHI